MQSRENERDQCTDDRRTCSRVDNARRHGHIRIKQKQRDTEREREREREREVEREREGGQYTSVIEDKIDIDALEKVMETY